MESQIQNLKSKIPYIPKSPGVYQFLDKSGAVLYVGKAKNLRSRVSQYFSGHDDRPQLPYLMAEAVDVSYTVVSNELESAFLENTVIKQYSPKYNIDLKDDKNYAFITIDYSSEIPQIGYSRKVDSPVHPRLSTKHLALSTIKYFGPYSAAYKIRNTLNLVRRIFPYCAAQKVGVRPCFYYYMHRCPGVCIGKISLDEYKVQLGKIIKFLHGDISSVTKEVRLEMQKAAKAKKFELAARLRDQLRALEILREKQNMILPKKVDWDVVSLAASDGYACVNLFKVREGKLFDKENFVYEIPTTELHNSSTTRLARRETRRTDDYKSEILQRFLEQYYLETSSAPKCVYTQIGGQDEELIRHIINSRFNKKVPVSVPQKGKVKQLVNLGKLNAEEYLKKWLSDKAGSLDKINSALAQLKEALCLDKIPDRIECYDISNIQGTNAVGSMVVFEKGLPKKSEYRKFRIKSKKTPDDFAMMKEILARRMARSNQQTADNRQQKQWPLPDLIVIDGGKGQLSAAMEVLSTNHLPARRSLGEGGALSTVPLIGLAKKIEEIFVPGKSEPIILSHDDPGLQLLQRLRDEAHRFGITYHRALRSKQAVKSALDDIPGIGPKTKKLLKQKFGTVANIKKTSLDELAAIVGERIAQAIKLSL